MSLLFKICILHGVNENGHTYSTLAWRCFSFNGDVKALVLFRIYLIRCVLNLIETTPQRTESRKLGFNDRVAIAAVNIGGEYLGQMRFCLVLSFLQDLQA